MNPDSKLIDFYIGKGFSITPLNGKEPFRRGWVTESLSEAETRAQFSSGNFNIGVRLGGPSGGIVDVDLDDDVVRQIAPAFLPATGMKFGRESAPAGHYIYQVEVPGKTIRHSGSSGALIELRSEGCQTMFPGSIHPDTGEAIEFERRDDPAEVSWADLERAVSDIAIAAVLIEHWHRGKRHNIALAVSGAMARSGRPKEEVERLISLVATHCGDEEPQDRILCVIDTFDTLENGRSVAGVEALRNLLGADGACIAKWIGLKPNLRRTVNGIEPDSDAACADLFAKETGGNLRYAPTLKHWYRLNNGVFEKVSDEELQNAVVKTGCCIVLKDSGNSRIAKKFVSASGINNIISLARSGLSIEPDSFDIDEYLVGCKNGVLSLNDAEIIDPGSSIVTKRLGARFNRQAKCPQFLAFLDSIFANDTDVIDFVHRAVGYSLSGSTGEQCLFVLVGNGANGKSTLLSIISALLGDYGGTTPMQTLMVSKYGSQATNDLAALVGKRFVSASEGEAGAKLAEAKIKMMTGGDLISCRKLYGEFFEYTPMFKLWLATNELPRIDGTTEGIWRRFNVIEFPVTFQPHERDKELLSKLKSELPGILNWAVEGFKKWKQEGLNPPAKVREATAAYRSENDTVRQFVDTCCERVTGAREKTASLFEAYELWCGLSGVETLPKIRFAKELGRLGFEGYKGASGNGWRGVKLKDETPIPC